VLTLQVVCATVEKPQKWLRALVIDLIVELCWLHTAQVNAIRWMSHFRGDLGWMATIAYWKCQFQQQWDYQGLNAQDGCMVKACLRALNALV